MTEADFCDQLRTWAEAAGLVAYPEIGGWDLVLVARMDTTIEHLDLRMGDQVGIHAKLRANCTVLAQAMPPDWDRARYPAFGIVAAPRAGLTFRDVARRLGLGVVELRGARPRLTVQPRRVHDRTPLALPSFASRSIRAGMPSPRQLSSWREKALTFLRWARANDGAITLADLKRYGLARNWAASWLVDTGTRTGRLTIYRLTPNPQALPDWGYADVYAELCAVLDRAA